MKSLKCLSLLIMALKEIIILTLILGSSFFYFAAEAQASIVNIKVDPPNPDCSDNCTITVEGHFSDGCWMVTDSDRQRTDNIFRVSIYAHDAWQPGTACVTILVPYLIEWPVGKLAKGNYEILVYEYHNSLRDPTTEFLQKSLTVTSDKLGDTNCDDNRNSTDALIILSCDVGLNTAQFCPMNCGDVNTDGLINSTDALIILSYDVGMSVLFPVGQSGCNSTVIQCEGCKL
jgi:hypothetical protein